MTRPRITQLSSTQERIAKAIASIERTGFAASVSALVKELGLAGSSSLVPTLRIMQRNEFVSIQGGGGFGRDQLIKLTAKGRFAINEGGLPVLGEIRAGPLEEAVAEPDTVFEERDFLPYRPGDFLLKVKGDSMIGDGILPGDHVLLRPNVQVAQGEIAAVLVGDAFEATLKRFYLETAPPNKLDKPQISREANLSEEDFSDVVSDDFESGASSDNGGAMVRLKAGNPKYADILVPAAEVKIAGVFRGLIRHDDPFRRS
jgi:repressor LexA